METNPAPTPPRTNNSRNQSANKGGRPLGSMSKIAKEAREKAIATGMLPHEILLSISRGEMQTTKHVDQETGVITTKHFYPEFDQRIDSAKAAAPYYAPKISTVEVIAGVSDDDLDRIIESAAAEAGVSLSALGEGSEDEGEGDEGGVAPSASPERTRRERKRAIRPD